MKGNSLIYQTRIKNPLKTGISFSRAFEEIEACVAAGMDVERWLDPRPEMTYSKELKVEIVAWYRLRGMIEVHTGDAQVEHQKREARKKK